MTLDSPSGFESWSPNFGIQHPGTKSSLLDILLIYNSSHLLFTITDHPQYLHLLPSLSVSRQLDGSNDDAISKQHFFSHEHSSDLSYSIKYIVFLGCNFFIWVNHFSYDDTIISWRAEFYWYLFIKCYYFIVNKVNIHICFFMVSLLSNIGIPFFITSLVRKIFLCQVTASRVTHLIDLNTQSLPYLKELSLLSFFTASRLVLMTAMLRVSPIKVSIFSPIIVILDSSLDLFLFSKDIVGHCWVQW